MVSVKPSDDFPQNYLNAAAMLVGAIELEFYPVSYAVWSQPDIDDIEEWKLTIAFDENLNSPGKFPITYVKDIIGHLDNMPEHFIDDIIVKVGSYWDTDPNCEAGIVVKLPDGVTFKDIVK